MWKVIFFRFRLFRVRQISGSPSSSDVDGCTVSSCQSGSVKSLAMAISGLLQLPYRSLTVTTSGLLQLPICCDALAMLTSGSSSQDSSPQARWCMWDHQLWQEQVCLHQCNGAQPERCWGAVRRLYPPSSRSFCRTMMFGLLKQISSTLFDKCTTQQEMLVRGLNS